jgi:arginyl-tRNA synthetase
MISTKSETTMDFDMNKVIEKNKDNQVFYCQYAYARASSVLKKAEAFEIFQNINNSINLFDKKDLSLYEWKIILKLLSWPFVLKQAAETKQPHRITNYLEDLCSVFHSFWNKGKDDVSLRIIDENNFSATISKLIWVLFFKKTLKQIFDIIDIESPETM